MPRRINISGTALEVLLALSQAPAGARISELAAALALAATTVEGALRALADLGIVARDLSEPVYRLRQDHPAARELVLVAERLTPPDRATEIVLRANGAVDFACRDDEGYVVAVDHRAAEPLHAALAGALDRIPARRPAPAVTRFESLELARLLRVVPSLRVRITAAELLKG